MKKKRGGEANFRDFRINWSRIVSERVWKFSGEVCICCDSIYDIVLDYRLTLKYALELLQKQRWDSSFVYWIWRIKRCFSRYWTCMTTFKFWSCNILFIRSSFQTVNVRIHKTFILNIMTSILFYFLSFIFVILIFFFFF